MSQIKKTKITIYKFGKKKKKNKTFTLFSNTLVHSLSQFICYILWRYEKQKISHKNRKKIKGKIGQKQREKSTPLHFAFKITTNDIKIQEQQQQIKEKRYIFRKRNTQNTLRHN